MTWSADARRRGAQALLVLALTWGPSPALAAGEDESKIEIGAVDIRSLLDLEVNAVTRRSERASQAPATVFVLTREDLRRNGFRTLDEVLGSVPGLFSYPGNFRQTGVRGMGVLGDYTTRLLVLVDGHPLTSSVGVDLGRGLPVPLAALERVEVIKGPVGSVYGPSAFFGVVNLVTKGGPSGVEAWVGGEAAQGRIPTGEASAVARAGAGDLQGLVAADVYRTSGLDWTFPELAGTPGLPADGKVTGMDYGDAGSGYARVSWRGLDVSGACGHSYAGIPLTATGDHRTALEGVSCFADASYQLRVGETLSLRPRVAYDDLEQRAAVAGSIDPVGTLLFQNKGHDRWFSAELRADWRPLEALRVDVGSTLQLHGVYHHTYLTGLPLLDASVDRTYRTLNNWLLAELRLGHDLALHGGITLFSHSIFGDRFTPKVAAVWQPTALDTVKAIWSEGFRPPTFVEAFVEDGFHFLANPALRPETVQSAEVAYEHRFGEVASVGGSLFRNEYRDLIHFELVPAPGLDHTPDPMNPLDFRQVAQNTGTVVLLGGELAVALRCGDALQAYGGVSVQRVDQGERPNFPTVTANLALSTRALWRPLLLTARATAIAARDMDSFSGGGGDVPAAVSLSALAALDVPGVPGLSLELSVVNALDGRNASPAPADSAPVTALPEAARTFRGDVRYRF
jgi:outer membrane receptor protein involved in Fe transport